MKKTSFLLLLVFNLCFSQSNPPTEWDQESNDWEKPELEVSIKIKQQNFFLGQPIIIDIYIRNTDVSENTVTLKLKKDLVENLELNLIDSKNSRISPSMEYLSKLQNQYDDKQKEYLYEFSKELETQTIELNYGETFITQIDLNNFFELNEGVDYFLSGNFKLTVPFNENNSIKVSFPMNSIFFRIQDNIDKIEIKTLKKTDDLSGRIRDNGELVAKNKVAEPPYEVVQSFLETQKNRDWSDHFSKVDLFSLLNKSYFATPLYERFVSAEKDEKNFILKDFKDAIIKSYDYNITSFNVYQSFIVKDEATVKADVAITQHLRRWGRSIDPTTQQVEEKWNTLPNSQTESKLTFTFHLIKMNGNWKIIQKDVTIGSQRKIDKTIVEERPTDLEFKEVVYFDLGQYDIDPKYYSNLKNVQDYLKMNSNYVVTLKGYTDETGNDSFNLLLSRRRSARIRQYLTDKLGIGPEKIKLSWYGKEDPASVNHALNRRVEIFVSQP